MSKNWPFLIFCFFIFTPFFVNAQNFNEFFKIPIPGRVEGKGTHFEIKDSEYLNIILESEKEIEVVLESIPKMISLNIVSSTEATATLTLKGLEPNKKYFKYEDTHKNETEFFPDQNGSYSWQQDLANPHHIWIQEIKGTFFIPFDPSNPTSTNQCISPYGEWIPESRTCKLLQDLTEGIEITTSTLILDCNGHTIIGSGSGHGIYSFATENVTIKNCIIKNFSDGIYSLGSFEISISSSTISDNYNGIVISFYSDRITEKVEITNSNIINNKGWGIFGGALSVEVKGNNISNNFQGLALSGREHQEFNGNIISNNQSIGFYLSPSIESYLSSNQIENNKYNLSIGKENNLELLLHKIDTSNTINGKPIYYLINERDKIIDSSLNPGYLGIVNSENITIRNLSIQNNGEGIFLAWTRNSKVEGNKISNNQFGIFLFSSSNNQIVGNEILNSQDFSIGNWGIVLTVTSSNNLVRDNTILGNVTGIEVEYSSNNNLIYHNNFRNNYWGAQVWQATGNLFDNGYPSGGNFWSNYNTPDEGCFDENRDGFCDNPYTFFGGQDNYPFLKENSWILPKVLISEVYYDPDKKHKGEGEEEGNYEWVIIHNLEKNEIDLRGWQICDNEKCDNIPTSSIPSNGLAIITPTSTTFSFWRIPKDMVRIVLGNKFGGHGLANSGDRVILKDKEGKIVDAMSYGNDTFIFFPECTKELKAKEGKSLLRDPPYKDTDTCEDFKESEPTIGKNWLPIPIINYFPKNPIKGVKVKFDASLSDDPDGEIAEYFWEIKKGEGILVTSTAITTTFAFLENGDYQITLIATDNDGATSSTSTTIKVEPFSFAIITDLHIGWGIPDYNGEGFEEYPFPSHDAQDYYITKRLEMAVDWINNHYKENNIKFVVVLGDISDTAEYSEFLKAREVLNKLEIPYVPILGNHDIWPYTQKITADPDNRLFSIKEKSSGSLLGDAYFDIVFWGSENSTNAQRIKNFFDYFERQEDLPEYQGPPYFTNYAFGYGGVNFISLDFASREPKNFYNDITKSARGITYSETINWFKNIIKNHQDEKNIILTHYPFKIPVFYPLDRKEISDIIRDCNCKVFTFAGHTHINSATSTASGEYDIVETEPTSQIPVHPTYTLTGEFIRLVEVTGNDTKEISYDKLIDGFPLAINPYFTANKEEVAVGERIKFTAHTKNLKQEDIFSYQWDFDKNYSATCKGEKNEECIVAYNQPGVYKITLKAIPAWDRNYFEEVYWYFEVKREAKPFWKIILPISNTIPLLNGEKEIDLTKEENAQNTTQWVVPTKLSSSGIPIGAFQVHFERATGDINLFNLVADTNSVTKKSILYMPDWPEIIEESKILFIPK